MKHLKLIICLLLFISFIACDKDDDKNPGNIYENCCTSQQLDFNFNPGKIYLPNIFTPKNLDGINDVFFVIADENIEIIAELKILDDSGTEIFRYENGLPNTPTNGWFPSDDIANGYYQFVVKVKNINDELFEATGGICIFECDEENLFEFTDNCAFQSQNNGNGSHDSNISNFEEDCM